MNRYLFLSLFAVSLLIISCKNRETTNENTTSQHEDSLRNKVLNEAGKMLDTTHKTGPDTTIKNK